MAPEKALDILNSDVKKGRLDENLVSVFIESGLWKSARYLEGLEDSEKRGKARP